MQGAFLGAPQSLNGSGFVEGISEEGDDARDEIEDENDTWQASGNYSDSDKNQKANGKQRGSVAAPRRIGWSGQLTNKPYYLGLSMPLDVDL